MLKKVNKDTKVITKWSPIVENNFNYKNVMVRDLICFYCEWYSSNGSSDLAEKLMEMKDKIDSFDRIKIVGKFFNPASGLIEYMLEDGRFVPIKGGKLNFEIPDDKLIEIFGIDFIRNLDPEKFRDNQINKIL